MRFLFSSVVFCLSAAVLWADTPTQQDTDSEAALALALAMTPPLPDGCDCLATGVCVCAVCDCGAVPVSVVDTAPPPLAYAAARLQAVSQGKAFVVGVGVQPPMVQGAVVYRAESLPGAVPGQIVWASPNAQGDLTWTKTTTPAGDTVWQPQASPVQTVPYYGSFGGNGAGCSGGTAGFNGYVSAPRFGGGLRLGVGLFGGGGCANGVCR